MKIRAVRTRLFREREDLAAFVRAHIKKVPEKSVLVVASKIVALSEGRTENRRAREKLIRKESGWVARTKRAWLTVKDGVLMPNAGIDESNADGKIVLLPKNSFRSAARIRVALRQRYRVKKLGVVISDSALAPLRAGTTAHAVGYAGIKGIRDYRGKKDLFGRKMKISRTNVADSLATAAALVMGEGAERQPLALITNAPVEFTDKTDKKESRIAAREDLYWPLIKTIKKVKGRRN